MSQKKTSWFNKLGELKNIYKSNERNEQRIQCFFKINYCKKSDGKMSLVVLE